MDGFDKEMCIYNTKDFSQFSRVREEHTNSVLNTLKHRGQMGVLDILDEVKGFVEEHGLTGTKDITIGEIRESRWGHKKLSSAALDYLFNKGELCVANRKYGYYVIPVIYNNCFVARFEPEPINKTGCFSIKNWWWETNIYSDDRMRRTIINEMNRFSEYLKVECDEKNKTKIGE